MRKLGNHHFIYVEKKLSLQYAPTISSNSKNPAKNIIFNPSYTENFVNKPKEIKPLGLRLKDNLDKLKINPDNILQNDEEEVPPWNSPKMNTDLSNLKKSSNSPEHLIETFPEIKEEYEDFIHMYTDGS
jgi:hypothetical protein